MRLNEVIKRVEESLEIEGIEEHIDDNGGFIRSRHNKGVDKIRDRDLGEVRFLVIGYSKNKKDITFQAVWVYYSSYLEEEILWNKIGRASCRERV